MLRPNDTPFEYISFAAAERERLELLPVDTLAELERTARLLCGDLTVEPKRDYDYEWYVGSKRFGATAHAGGYMNQSVMIRWRIGSLWGEAGNLQHPSNRGVDRGDDSIIIFDEEYRRPRRRREIELTDDFAARLQADVDRPRQIDSDPAVVETDSDAFQLGSRRSASLILVRGASTIGWRGIPSEQRCSMRWKDGRFHLSMLDVSAWVPDSIHTFSLPQVSFSITLVGTAAWNNRKNQSDSSEFSKEFFVYLSYIYRIIDVDLADQWILHRTHCCRSR